MYLKSFNLASENMEYDLLVDFSNRRLYDSLYPFRIFTNKKLERLSFENITIFYGNNGSGKSTLLNIVAETLGAVRKTEIDKGDCFYAYVKVCKYDMAREKPLEIKIVTSDDIFDYLLDIRSINAKVNRTRETLSSEYLKYKSDNGHVEFNDYETLKKKSDAKNKTMASYIRERLSKNIAEQSNGESALMFWEKEINENSLYILDEPENSLSAENQLKLKKFIEESVRFFGCQFIISTHSPFLLGLTEAKIYDLDTVPVCVKDWTKLENVKIYHDFFKENESSFNSN